jgi:hypothetical protein
MMLDTRSKLTITVIMWLALVIFMSMVVDNVAAFPEAWTVLPLTLVPLVFGFFVTLALWSPVIFPWIDAERLRTLRDDRDIPAQSTKRKRDQQHQQPGGQQLDALLSLMSDSEREEFKRALKRRVLENASVGQDGEIEYGGLSLSRLLDEDDPQAGQGRR